MQLDGYFNANGEPAILLDLGSGAMEIVVDTGFSGSLILPTSLAGGLPLQIEGFEEFLTATGQPFIAPFPWKLIGSANESEYRWR